MTDTAHDTEEEMVEHFDDPTKLKEKIKQLAQMIRESEHLVCFTGAGISTSAGIPDFRGPNGKWTRKAKGLRPLKGKSAMSAHPTKTHMALVKLARMNKLKWLISQNCDGLHLRSGFPQDRISELHGNGNKEICEKCGQTYFRDLKCKRLKKGRDHWTGRFCVRENCDGRLLNSTIDFEQELHEKPLQWAEYHSEKADLHIALGSSLSVTPAADCPQSTVYHGGKLVIINLQETPLTSCAELHIHARTDEVIEELMSQLEIEIPPFTLNRKLLIGCEPNANVFYCRGADVDDPTLEMDFIKSVNWSSPIFGSEDDENYFDHDGQILETNLPANGFTAPFVALQNEIGKDRVFVQASIEFAGHYDEPPLTVTIDVTQSYVSSQRVEYLFSLEFNPYEKTWNATRELSNVGFSEHEIDTSYGDGHASYNIDALMKKLRKNRFTTEKWWKRHIKRCTKNKKEAIRQMELRATMDDLKAKKEASREREMRELMDGLKEKKLGETN